MNQMELDNRSEGLTTAIMAGGQSSRMGTDKSFIPLLGKPMVEHVIDKLDGLGDELILITNQKEKYAYLDCATFGDLIPEKGPLGGLYTALSHSSNPHVLVVACDMPWLNRSLLDHMISLRHEAAAVVPRWKKHPEPIHAIYSKMCLPPILSCIEEDKLKMIAFYSKITVRYLEQGEIAQFDEYGRSFANINTPEELKDAQKRRFNNSAG
jgi:molybdopterin-guanine dinucleotide biosynthesis protein A